MTSKEAKAYLEQIREIETKIRHEKAEKERWLDLATSCTPSYSADMARGSGDKQRMESVIVNGICKEPKFDENISRLFAERQKIIDDIRSLPEAESDILYRVYVEYQTLKEVAYARKESYSLITTQHGIALKKIAAILSAKCNKKQTLV